MKTLILLDLNPAYIEMPILPIGSYIIGGIAKSFNWEVQYLSYNEIFKMNNSLISYINKINPELIGVSIRNIDNTQGSNPISYIETLDTILRLISAEFKEKTILGGSGFSLFPDEIISKYQFIYGIVGRAGKAFHNILLQFDKGLPLERIFSSKLIDGRIDFDYRFEQITNLWGGAMNNNKIKGSIGIDTQLGCSHRCIYCSYPNIVGRHKYYRNIEEIVEFYKKATFYRFKQIQILDDVFNDNLEHSNEICQNLINFNNNLIWSCYLRPDNTNYHFIKLLKQSKCNKVILGVDSLADEILEKYQKSFGVKQITETTELLKKAGIKISFSLIVNSEFENENTLAITLNNLIKLNPDDINVQYGIRIYPSTDMCNLIRNNSYSNLLYPHFSINKDMENSNIFKNFIKIVGDYPRRKML